MCVGVGVCVCVCVCMCVYVCGWVGMCMCMCTAIVDNPAMPYMGYDEHSLAFAHYTLHLR